MTHPLTSFMCVCAPGVAAFFLLWVGLWAAVPNPGRHLAPATQEAGLLQTRLPFECLGSQTLHPC